MPRADAVIQQGLLLASLALRSGLVDQAVLIAAIRAWRGDRSRSLAQVLADRGHLGQEIGAQLAGLVTSIEAHQGGFQARRPWTSTRRSGQR